MGLFVGVGSNSSSPGVHAYDFTSLAGWGTKFGNPSSATGMAIRSLNFSVAKDFFVGSGQSTPFLHGYAFSSSGFGTKFSDPSTLVPSGGQNLALNSTVVAINAGSVGLGVYPVTVSGFGTKFTNPVFAGNGVAVAFSPSEDYIVISASNVAPYIHAWAWNNSTGFGTKVSNPAFAPGAQSRRIAFSRNGAQVAVAHPTTPYAYAWAWSGGFGARINPIGIILAGAGQALSFGNSSAVFAGSATSLGGLRGGPWSSSGFASTSIPPSTTAPWPAGGGGVDVKITKLPNKVFSAFGVATPYAMSWSETLGFSAGTSLYSAPLTLPNAVLLAINASKEDYDLLADVRSYLFTGNAATLTRTVTSPVLACSVASFALAGNQAGLASNRKLAGSLGPYLVTVSATGLVANRNLATSLGPYLVTVSATGLASNRQLPANLGQFFLAGTATGLDYVPVVAGATLVADSIGFAWLGSATGLASNRQLLANRGPYLVTVQAAGLASNRKLAGSLGQYLVQAFVAGFVRGRNLPGESVSFFETGLAVALKADRKLQLSFIAFVFAGNELPTVVSRLIVAGNGAFSFVGNNLQFQRVRRLVAGTGSFSCSMLNFGLSVQRNLGFAVGPFLTTGFSVGLNRALNLFALSVAYAWNGQLVRCSLSKSLAGVSYVLTGNLVGFNRGRRLELATGSLVVGGLPIVFFVNRKLLLSNRAFACVFNPALLLPVFNGLPAVQISDSLLNGSSSSQSLVGAGTVGNTSQSTLAISQAKLVDGTVGYTLQGTVAITQALVVSGTVGYTLQGSIAISQSLVGSATVGNTSQGSVVAGQALAVAGTVGHVVVSDLLATQETGH